VHYGTEYAEISPGVGSSEKNKSNKIKDKIKSLFDQNVKSKAMPMRYEKFNLR